MTRFTQIKMSHVESIDSAVLWCYEKFGNAVYPRKDSRWIYCGQRLFEFQHEKDATMFVLRWS